MKKLLVIILFSISTLSCEKNYLIPEKEIPDWLKSEIKVSEQRIQDNPKCLSAWGAWTRSEWQNEYYFEYINPLSSFLCGPISQKGDTLNIYTGTAYLDYGKERCCTHYVWKGPLFKEF